MAPSDTTNDAFISSLPIEFVARHSNFGLRDDKSVGVLIHDIKPALDENRR